MVFGPFPMPGDVGPVEGTEIGRPQLLAARCQSEKHLERCDGVRKSATATASGMPSDRACSIVIPCTAVASGGISRPGSIRPDQLVRTTPSTTETNA